MSTHALLRVPVSCGEFLAQWPSDVRPEDFETMRVMFVACMDAWSKHRAQTFRERSAADAEYESWFRPPTESSRAAQGDGGTTA